MNGRGQHGDFYIINNEIGIKLYHKPFKSIPEALKGIDLLIDESLCIINCEKSRMTPLYYGRSIVDCKDHFRAGICMSYLGNVKLTTRAGLLANRCSLDRMTIVNRIIKRLDKRLQKKGIKHNDLNESNIIWFKNKWYVIDLIGINLI